MKIRLFSIIMVILSILIIFLFSCSNNEDQETQTYHLKVTIYNNPDDKTPVEGVIVFINSSSNKELINSMETNSNGVADFGNLSMDRVDLSYAYETTDEEGGTYRRITTGKGIPVGNIDLYLYEYSEEHNPIASINANISGLPETYSYTNVFPFFDQSFSPNGDTHSNINVYEENIQNDNKISLLAAAYDSNNEPTKYGYLLDQDLENGNTYNIDLNKDPSSISFTTNRGISELYFSILRKGVWYSELYEKSYDNPITSGDFPALDNFPIANTNTDYYQISFSYDEQNGNFTEWFGFLIHYISLPGAINANIPTFQINSLNLNPDNRNISWGTTGEEYTLDYYDIYFTYENENSNVYAYWEIFTGADDKNCEIPELPSEISNWIDLNNLNDYGIIGVNIDDIDGIDELYSNLDNYTELLNKNLIYYTGYGYSENPGD